MKKSTLSNHLRYLIDNVDVPRSGSANPLAGIDHDTCCRWRLLSYSTGGNRSGREDLPQVLFTVLFQTLTPTTVSATAGSSLFLGAMLGAALGGCCSSVSSSAS